MKDELRNFKLDKNAHRTVLEAWLHTLTDRLLLSM